MFLRYEYNKHTAISRYTKQCYGKCTEKLSDLVTRVILLRRSPNYLPRQNPK